MYTGEFKCDGCGILQDWCTDQKNFASINWSDCCDWCDKGSDK